MSTQGRSSHEWSATSRRAVSQPQTRAGSTAPRDLQGADDRSATAGRVSTRRLTGAGLRAGMWAGLVLLVAGLVAVPAHAAPTGDRAERCERAARAATDVRTLANGFRTHWSSTGRSTAFSLINTRLQAEASALASALAAAENRALLTRIRQISRDIASGTGDGRQQSILDVLDHKANTLVSNAVQRREFTITFVDESGQQQTKTTAC